MSSEASSRTTEDEALGLAIGWIEMGRVPVRVGSFYQSSKSRQTYRVVVVEVGGPWTLKPRRLPKRLDRLLMSRFLLKSTAHEKKPSR